VNPAAALDVGRANPVRPPATPCPRADTSNPVAPRAEIEPQPREQAEAWFAEPYEEHWDAVLAGQRVVSRDPVGFLMAVRCRGPLPAASIVREPPWVVDRYETECRAAGQYWRW
jgi:hypothetical protein